jgi:hypothetical protein
MIQSCEFEYDLELFNGPRPLDYCLIDNKVMHKKKMHWVFNDIVNPIYCTNCHKRILRYIYSKRNSDETCCSAECVDELYGNY